MRHLFPINATLILRVVSTSDDRDVLNTETDQHELSRLLRYRLAVLEAALHRVEELRCKAAKALLAVPERQGEKVWKAALAKRGSL
jgi:hypothetical protein